MRYLDSAIHCSQSPIISLNTCQVLKYTVLTFYIVSLIVLYLTMLILGSKTINFELWYDTTYQVIDQIASLLWSAITLGSTTITVYAIRN